MVSTPNAPRPRALLPFLFFLSLYALTSSGNAFRVPDEFEVYFQTEHLVDAGDISVPQTLAITQGGQPIFFGRFGLDGRPYAPYGPAVAYVLVPFHLVGRLIAAAAGVPRRPVPNGIPWEFFVGGITTLGTAFAAALAVAGALRAFVALGADERRAMLLTTLLGGATILWVYGTTLYSEAWLAACFAWASAFLLEARRGAGSRPRVVAATGLMTAAVLLKPTAVVIAPGFVIAVLFDRTTEGALRWRTVIALATGVAIGCVTQAAWNVERFGSPLEFGYNLGGMVPHPPARPFLLAELPRGIVVQLLTPGKALLLWAPSIVLSIVRLGDAWRRERGIVVGLACSLIAAVVFYAAFLYPEGGYAHGPQHLVPLVPLLMLPAAISARPFSKLLVIACTTVGVAMALLGASVSFLEDQAPPVATRSVYYERIDPPPGRPFNRYRLGYIPFVGAIGSGRWLALDRPPGNGPDFFFLHLARARRLMPGGEAIPPWLPWALSVPWLLVMGVSWWECAEAGNQRRDSETEITRTRSERNNRHTEKRRNGG